MKKLLASLITAALVLAVGSIAAKAIDLDNGVRIYGDGQIYLLGGTKSSDNLPEGSDEPLKKISDYMFVGNLSVSKKFESNTTAILHLRGSSNEGAAGIGLGNFRGGINDAFDPNLGASNIYIKELYIIQPIADNLVVLTIGKTAYLGNNLTAIGSIGSFFTDDATIAYAGKADGANRDTIKIAINPIDALSITYGYSDGPAPENSANTKFGSNGYNAVEVNIKPIEKTNLRIGYWNSAVQANVVKDGVATGETDGANGIWFSGDTGVVENLTFMAKVGLRLDDTVRSQAGMHWAVGAKLGGAFWGRNSDALSLFVGGASIKDLGGDWLKVPVADKTTGVTKEEDYPMELHVEANYVYTITPGLSLTAFVQFVSGIVTTSTVYSDAASSVSDTGIAGGLKLAFSF